MNNPRRRSAAMPQTALVLGLLGLGGCLSSTEHVMVETDPPGATIYVNGMKQGVSPRKVALPFEEHDRAFLQVVASGRVPCGNWYTPDTVPEDGRVVIQLTRD